MAGKGQKPVVKTPPVKLDTNNPLVAAFLGSLQSGNSNQYAIPTTTSTTYLDQTSAPDIYSTVNAMSQKLTGKYASPELVKSIGAQILAAEKEYPGRYTGETTYQQSGKRGTVTGTQLTQGVNVQGLVQSLIEGTADARQYQAATGFLDGIVKANNQFKGAYSG